METDKKEEQRTVFMLADDTIAVVAKLLQLALITQTSIVDNFRTIRLEPDKTDPTKLVPTPEYNQWFEEGVKLLEEKAKMLMSQMQTAESQAGKQEQKD